MVFLVQLQATVRKRIWRCTVRDIEELAMRLGIDAQAVRLRRRGEPRATGVGALQPDDVHRFVEEAFGDDLHAKRVLSIANAVVGVLHSTALTIHAIGQGLAAATGKLAKHGIKQVDRLLSNNGFKVERLQELWVPFVLAGREEVFIALDWTEFDADDQSTLAASVVTNHGRATPLVWKTVKKSQMKNQRNAHEDELLARLARLVPKGVRATILADRGFGDSELYKLLDELGLSFIIRFRSDIWVADSKGNRRKAREWVHPNGRARRIDNAAVTADQVPLPAVVCVHDKRMKEPWHLATNRADLPTRAIVQAYGRRFTIEESFRDHKDLRYGMGLSSTHIGTPARRDRLLFIAAIAHSLLTLLGAAAEDVGLDRYLKASTTKRRTHSLFRQGLYWYGALPKQPDERVIPLLLAFQARVSGHALFAEVFGVL